MNVWFLVLKPAPENCNERGDYKQPKCGNKCYEIKSSHGLFSGVPDAAYELTRNKQHGNEDEDKKQY